MKLKYILIVIFLLSIISVHAWSAGVVQYDKKTGHCLWVDLSANEIKYEGLPDFMIFTDKTVMTVGELSSLLKTVQIIYLKKSGDPGVVEMTQAEKDIVDGNIQDEQTVALGKQYKDRIDNDFLFQATVEELATQAGLDPVKLKGDIEQNVANKLGLPNL